MSEPTRDLAAIEAERDRIRTAYLRESGSRSPSTARGLHHTALISSDVERTVRFYQDVLGFPLTELIENRDYAGSSHFFFDIGNGNLLAFFDFPGLDVGPYAEVLGGLHHMAISVEPSRWEALRGRLTDAGVPFEVHSEVSMYFQRPRRCPHRADRRPARRDVRRAGALSDMALVVRPAAEPDRERWAELYRGYAAFYEVPAPDLDHLWRRITELGELECFVADLDGDVIGMAHVRAFARPLEGDWGGFLDDLFVDPDATRERGRRGPARAPALPGARARLGRGHLDHRRGQPCRPAALRPAGGGSAVGHLRHGARLRHSAEVGPVASPSFTQRQDDLVVLFVQRPGCRCAPLRITRYG